MKNAVIGIIFNDNRNKVLALRRRDVDIWVFPGGGVELNELPEQAIIREVLEETGLHVKVSRKIGEYTPLNRLARLTHVFECHPIDGELSTGSETREIGYYSVNKLPQLFFPVHEDWLKDALLNAPSVIHKPITRITYTECLKYLLQHPIMLSRFVLSRMGFPINS